VPIEESIKLQIQDQIKDLPDIFKKEIEIKDQMYETVPNAECPSGTRGRVAIFEMFKVDKEMQTVILKNPIDSEIYKVARADGMFMMREDAMLKAINGVIPYKEVFNFINENE
jgi:type IV pilus assembly protein PilB